MTAKPGDFCLLLEPHAKDRRGIVQRLKMAYKALARLGLRVKDHRERGPDGWNKGDSFKRHDCSACTTCAPCD